VDKLGNILGRVLSRQPGSGPLAEHRLRIAFRQVVGESLAAGCESIEVRGTTLSITTSNPALAHQLRLDSERLMQRLNEESRLTRSVRVIRVRVGSTNSSAGGRS
jgi:Dna[CI] antecedent DciA-like protein